MSTLKVDTIEPNSQAAVTLDSSAVVTGASTLTGNVTASGNVNVAGTLATSGTLTATKVALNGASPGSSGDVTGVNSLSCNNLSTGAATASSIAVTNGASVGSLTVDGETYQNRVTNHVSIAFSSDVDHAPASGVDPSSAFYFNASSSSVGITLSNNYGISSVAWQSGIFVGGQPTDKLRIQLSVGVSRPQQIIHMQFWDSLFETQRYLPRFRWVSSTVIDVYGWSLTNISGTNDPIRYLTMAMIG